MSPAPENLVEAAPRSTAAALLPTLAAGLEPYLAADGMPTYEIPADRILEVCRALRDRAGFDYPTFITAVDRHPVAPRFELVYQLRSLATREEVRLKVRLDISEAHLPSVIEVWPGANWLEREVWDLYGIVFDGHPDLRRLLLPDDFPGHPLRKDMPLGGEEVEFSQERPQ